MIDLKFLRENPELVKENIKKKFQDHKRKTGGPGQEGGGGSSKGGSCGDLQEAGRAGAPGGRVLRQGHRDHDEDSQHH